MKPEKLLKISWHKKMFDHIFIRKTLLFIILAETVSLATFYFPHLQFFAFIFLALLFLTISLKDLRYGIWLVIVDLIIGSKGGYLFFLDVGDSRLSIRITFWLILLSVWFIRYFVPNLLSKNYIRLLPINLPWFEYFGVLLIFILWGIVNGYLKGNTPHDIFFDFNSYLYFLLVLPFFSILRNIEGDRAKKFAIELYQIITVSVIWISTKTLILLFLFSHKLDFLNVYIYKWVRDTGVGEITKIEGGFYRIFFQSHLFVLSLFIVFLIILFTQILDYKISFKKISEYKKISGLFLLTTILLMVNIVSMSRSNWIGLALVIIILFILIAWKKKLKGVLTFFSIVSLLTITSFFLIVAIVKFPYPKPIGGFETSNIFSERATELEDEAGVSSRWNLLPELITEIRKNPLLGGGFGSTVTYISNDPRVLSANPNGVYTTFAFEWGWLDIWLKLGLFGVLFYLYFIFYILWKILKEALAPNKYNQVYIGFVLIIVAISSINFFSPYLNHPLGIGLLIILLLIYETTKSLNSISGETPLAKK